MLDVFQLVKRYGTADPFRIAEQLDIDVVYVDFPPAHLGQVMTDADGEPVILINNDLMDSLLRYTVAAHELKHAMDHIDLPIYYAFSYGGKGKMEREADLFASELMLYLYLEQFMEYPETFEQLQHTYGIKEDTADYLINGE